jgi:hypothetical protein
VVDDDDRDIERAIAASPVVGDIARLTGSRRIPQQALTAIPPWLTDKSLTRGQGLSMF